MKTYKQPWWRLGVVVWVSVLCACNTSSSSGGGGGTSASVTNGVVVGLTDAPGDFITYQVDVTSLTLTKADGTVVETLPAKTRVDFAHYVDMTEFLAAATLPSGTYTGVTMTIDYSNADIEVEGLNGNAVAVPVSSILDEQGNAITAPVKVAVVMAGGGPLTVTAGVSTHLTVDFNLDASNAVTLSTINPSPSLTIRPVILADVDPADPKPHRLRGALHAVDLQQNTFQVDLRPFFYQLTGTDQFGTLAVGADSGTIYDIDGTLYQGGNGLNQLAATLQSGTAALVPVVVYGSLDTVGRTVTATEVRAGTSVPGYQMDAVKGTVVQRTNGTLTVKGATVMYSDGSIAFADTAVVLLAANTTVVRQFDGSDNHGTGDISVGQRITAFGSVNNSNPSQPALDTANGRVWMGQSTLRGRVAVAKSPATTFAVNLQSIDGRDINNFTFTGTGANGASDADPTNYLINTGSLNVSSLARDALVVVRGFVVPFGTAGAFNNDFTASAVVDLTTAPAVLAVDWSPPTANAFFQPLSTSGLTLQTGMGQFHSLVRDGVITDLSAGGDVIQPQRSDLGVFLIGNNTGFVETYSNFNDFVVALQNDLNASGAILDVTARGTFDDATATLTAAFIEVRLK